MVASLHSYYRQATTKQVSTRAVTLFFVQVQWYQLPGTSTGFVFVHVLVEVVSFCSNFSFYVEQENYGCYR